jgi:hypothetical protein
MCEIKVKIEAFIGGARGGFGRPPRGSFEVLGGGVWTPTTQVGQTGLSSSSSSFTFEPYCQPSSFVVQVCLYHSSHC